MPDSPGKRPPGRPRVYNERQGGEGAPTLSVRLDPSVHNYIKAKPEGPRSYIERLVIEDSEKDGEPIRRSVMSDIEVGVGGDTTREWSYLRNLLNVEFRGLWGVAIDDKGAYSVDPPAQFEKAAGAPQAMPGTQRYEVVWVQVAFTPLEKDAQKHQFQYKTELLLNSMPHADDPHAHETRYHFIRRGDLKAIAGAEDPPALSMTWERVRSTNRVEVRCNNYDGVWSISAIGGAMGLKDMESLQWETFQHAER